MRNKKTDDNITYFNSLFRHSTDIKIIKNQVLNGKKLEDLIVVYCEGLINSDLLIDSLLPDIQRSYELNGIKGLHALNYSETTNFVKDDPSVDQAIHEKVFDGYTVILINEIIYFFNTADPPKRSPEESASEVSVKGPRDAFVEDITSNIALVRKRLKTASMVTKSFTVGKRSNTKVSLVYMTDIQNKEFINEVTERIEAIDIDVLISDDQLVEMLSDDRYSLFPLLDSVSRPDGVVSSLARGRFAIFIDNVPNVVIGPANFGLILNTAEDEHMPFYYASFEMFIRIIGLILAIFLPAFWVSLSSYNMDQVPLSLLATIGASRIGLPFNPGVELLLMLALFELFREAGVRLPKAVGQTVAVVGGLIVGDAAIRAGLTSPTMLVVAAIASIASFTLGNQSLFGTVTILRVFSILCASVLGMFGFFLSLFITLGYLAKLESFNIPYLSPVSPYTKGDFSESLLKLPVVKRDKRAKILKTKDDDRQGET
jgi:hypothetical protein